MIPKWKQRQNQAQPKTAAQLEATRRRRLAKRKGDEAEGIVIARLKSMGLAQVRKIHTGQDRYGAYRKSVEGDIRAILPPMGRSVLTEVKYRPEKLSYVNIEKHQHDALQEAHDAGAIALVAWVSSYGIAIMRYPIPGWAKGKKLTWPEAEAMHLTHM